MSTQNSTPLMSRAFMSLVFAQFLSAFADNALIFALLAQLMNAGDGNHSALLQELFVIPYIILAPFAGPISDAFPKSTVMMTANAIKMVGTGLALSGLSPFVSYGVVGIGACLYSPAKYGILPQMVSPSLLVKANSAMEGGTIAAILLGALSGGMIASKSIEAAIAVCFTAYLLAATANLFIPKLQPEKPGLPKFVPMIADFFSATSTLVKNSASMASIFGTSAFWGGGAALRLILVAWIPFALGLQGPQWVSYMMGALSVGIVIGAASAAAFVPLERIGRSYFAGLFIGAAILALSLCDNLHLAFFLCALVGIVGGFHVIPLNAMLQEIGHEKVGAGRALAVQNLFENLFILGAAAIYSGLAMTFTPVVSGACFGIIMTVTGIIAYSLHRKSRV